MGIFFNQVSFRGGATKEIPYDLPAEIIPPQLKSNQLLNRSPQPTKSRLENKTLLMTSMPKELLEIKAAMTDDELCKLEKEVDRRLFQMNAKIANDLGMTASELEEVTSIADPRAIELMRSAWEQTVLHDKLLQINEEVFKEIHSEP